MEAGWAESDGAWMDEAVRAYGDRLVRFAWTLCQDRERAQDIAQETLWRLWRHHVAHPRDPVSEAWVFTVARRILVDEHRRSVRAPTMVPLDQAETRPAEGADAEQGLVVWAEVAKLPPKEREALVLFYYEDWSIRQVADCLGISENAVALRLMRARARLAQTLKEASIRG